MRYHYSFQSLSSIRGPSHLLSLPDELLLMVLLYLGRPDLLRIMFVCSRLYRIACDPVFCKVQTFFSIKISSNFVFPAHSCTGNEYTYMLCVNLLAHILPGKSVCVVLQRQKYLTSELLATVAVRQPQQLTFDNCWTTVVLKDLQAFFQQLSNSLRVRTWFGCERK